MQMTRITGEDLKIKINNHTVYYDDNGPVFAPVVIFIHGFHLNKSMWELQAEALKNNYRVIAYDLRGHGKSSLNTSDYSIDALSEELISFMDVLELDKAMLCGLS